MKRMTKKKATILAILVVPIIILLFIGYKVCLILYYKDLVSYQIDYSDFKIETKKVTYKGLSNTKINDLNIYIPASLKAEKNKYSNDGLYYIPKDEELDSNSNLLLISKSITCLEAPYNNDKRLQTSNINKLMKDNNINLESDLIKYYYNKRTKNSIFSSKNDIKMNYISDICVKNSLLISSSDNNYYLEGSLLGMLRVNDKNIAIHLYNEKKKEYYFISITKNIRQKNYKEIFTEKEVEKIISSIYFD